MWSSTAKKSSQQHRDGPTWSVSVFYLSAYLTSHDRGPAEVEQGDEHEDRSGPAGQPLLHDGGAQSAQGAELETSEAAQLHGGGVTFISTILISILTKVSMKARAAFGSMGSMKIGGSGSSDLLLGSSRSRTGRSSIFLASHSFKVNSVLLSNYKIITTTRNFVAESITLLDSKELSIYFMPAVKV